MNLETGALFRGRRFLLLTSQFVPSTVCLRTRNVIDVTPELEGYKSTRSSILVLALVDPNRMAVRRFAGSPVLSVTMATLLAASLKSTRRPRVR